MIKIEILHEINYFEMIVESTIHLRAVTLFLEDYFFPQLLLNKRKKGYLDYTKKLLFNYAKLNNNLTFRYNNVELIIG